MRRRILSLCIVLIAIAVRADRPGDPSAYNVEWDTPSIDQHGSMPLGNGDLSANAWVETSGDLVFYIGKTDAWDENGRLLKLGKIRVQMEPPLNPAGSRYRQRLDLATGSMRVDISNETEMAHIRLWVDANRPIIHIEFEGRVERSMQAQLEPWRTNRYTLPSIEVSDVMMHAPADRLKPTVVEPDTMIDTREPMIGWYHHNARSMGPAITAEIQGMTGARREDPLLHRTFGALVTGRGAERADARTLRMPRAREHHLQVHSLTLTTPDPAHWLAALRAQMRSTEATPPPTQWQAHTACWSNFWQRSWIDARSSTTAARYKVPRNNWPVRIGIDQTGANVFSGNLTNGSIRAGLDAIARHAAGPADAPPTPLPSAGAEWPHAFTADAWIRSGTAPAGRILDRITPGGSDGFLLDMPAPNTLRLIVGSLTISAPVTVGTDIWHHVAAQIDGTTGTLGLWFDGKEVATGTQPVGGDPAFDVSKAYALQRYITACAGRGRYPIKFNGSIFTVAHEGAPGDADYRRWGPGYWWQNTRLPYISACTSGDTEFMEPLLRMYVDELLPYFTERTRRYFGFKDAAFFPECIYFWGDLFSETYGWTPRNNRTDPLQESRWHKWEWVAGPELVHLMLDLYDHTGDAKLLETRILPTASAVMRFFDAFYTNRLEGKLVMHPAQALETWWDCTNPMSEVAGLHAITRRLLALPASPVTEPHRAFWARFLKQLPDLPTRMIDGQPALAPAARFASKSNIENPELYAVYPFRLCSFNRTNAPQGRLALQHRWDRGHAGWRQDELFMAYLGLTAEAQAGLIGRARATHTGSRFPAFWGPNYDWIPDQDHGGVLMKTLQAMALQTEPALGEAEDHRIFLLPAWPADWDVTFRLKAPQNTTVEAEYRNGKLVDWRVTPSSRAKDVVLPN